MSFSKPGAYGRRVRADVFIDSHICCDRCEQKNVPCLDVDCSEGEYSSFSMCEECIKELFREFERNHQKDSD